MQANLFSEGNNPAEKITIRRSRRAKRISARVLATSIEIVAPIRASQKSIYIFQFLHRDWIKRQLANLAMQSQAATSNEFTWFGRPITIVPGDQIRLDVSGCTLSLPVGYASHQVVNYLQRASRSELARLLQVISCEIGIYAEGLTVRSQSSRWGSCNHKNRISLNWRLALMPAEVARYVIVHELCHIGCMNHSPKFWSRVAEHCPGYRDHKAWLRQNGSKLMALFVF